MENTKDNAIIIQSGSPANSGGGRLNLTIVIITLALAGGGFLWWQSQKQKQNAKDEAGNIQTDEFARMASLFRKYIAPEWWGVPDFIKIMELSKQVTDWKKVVNSYANLYSGDNLEEHVRTALAKGSGPYANLYQQFLTNLNVKGLPQNSNGTGTVTAPVAPPVGITPKVTKIYIDNANNNVGLYLKKEDYGTGKTSLTLPKGVTLKPVTFIESVEFTYINTNKPFKVNLFKIALDNGSQYYVSNTSIVKKAPVLKGLPTPLATIGNLIIYDQNAFLGDSIFHPTVILA